MKYKRNEPFRYEFGIPVKGVFFISRMNGKTIASSEGEAQVLDISPSGLRMQCDLNIPSNQLVEISMKIIIGSREIPLIGNIMWQKKVYPSYHYGVALISDAFEEQIIFALKEFQKNHRLLSSQD
ncbi:PilZ domain-containing protein [Sutcliffiella deserti]|uniref:PilZ domain-containing protein n=1 Tax=Sutcliffiella deserti TaxID=2875501 RepID=UPI001CBB4CB8|nr:PilZ domain-containing protein [Sutcliffiella deserti]